MLTFGEFLSERVVTLPNSYGIARKDMPQIRSANVQDYLNWLHSVHGVVAHKETVAAAKLKPIQSAIETDRVHQMPQSQSVEKPMIVSKDWYILDGHHRWYQAKTGGLDLHIVRLSIPMKTLLQITHDYDKVEYHDI